MRGWLALPGLLILIAGGYVMGRVYTHTAFWLGLTLTFLGACLIATALIGYPWDLQWTRQTTTCGP